MKQTIEEAAKEYCNKNFPYSEHLHLTMSTAFGAGVEWYIDSIWHDADEEPVDGFYLTIIDVEDRGQKIEIAPWKSGKYQGEYTIHINLGKASIIKYADINDILPKGGAL